MPIYTKDSLETLKQSIDLVEVISPYIELRQSGASYKGLCPFHDEKTPSFMIQKGELHYHCFGCGAHGDAIHFLMSQQRISFTDAVQSLAEKFHVHLDVVEGGKESKGPPKKLLKDALEKAARVFHFYLLHTPEGHEALEYLFQRQIFLDFIRLFKIGLAPKKPGLLKDILQELGQEGAILEAAGLISFKPGSGYRDFFSGRITFPIHDPTGAVIGFSARKYKEESFGGKYINTPETPLFKKSRVLFGLNYCRRRIAKERKVIIVEGQIDALRLIQQGFDFVVAGQGTAFGEGHLKELLNLGVSEVYLALDSDAAGMSAAEKIGNLFQKEGVEVNVASLPLGSDPDSFLRDHGKEAFIDLLQQSRPYLNFLVDYHSRAADVTTPAGKNELVQVLTKKIREWKHSLMVHESLKKIANLLQVPEHIIGVGEEYSPNIHIRKTASIGLQTVDPARILESDFLRWLILFGAREPHFIKIAQQNIFPEDLTHPACQRIYKAYLSRVNAHLPCEILSLIENEEDQELLSSITDKKVNGDKAEEFFVETVQKILDRNWMEKREVVKGKIQSGTLSDEDALVLTKEFVELKRAQPKVVIPVASH